MANVHTIHTHTRIKTQENQREIMNQAYHHLQQKQEMEAGHVARLQQVPGLRVFTLMMLQRFILLMCVRCVRILVCMLNLLLLYTQLNQQKAELLAPPKDLKKISVRRLGVEGLKSVGIGINIGKLPVQSGVYQVTGVAATGGAAKHGGISQGDVIYSVNDCDVGGFPAGCAS